MEDIKTAMAFQAEYVAVSFPKNATDMEMARQLANVAGEPWRHKPAMIAKIERSEAIPSWSHPAASDGIMVARGDLAVEVGNAAVPALQKKHDPHGARDGQGHHHRHADDGKHDPVNPVPTRAEVSRRGQRGAGRHRRGDAQRRDGRRQVPGGNRGADGADRARKPSAPKTCGSRPTSPTSASAASTRASPWARCSPRTTWAARPSWR
jgi:hypothetical protein